MKGESMYEFAGVRVERIIEEEGGVVIEAAPTAAVGICSACGRTSARVHGRYTRELRDLPACGRPGRVRRAVRRFVCGADDCPRRACAEQIPGATARYRRAAIRLEAVLTAFGVALGGEAGARLAGRMGARVSGDTLLRLLGRDEVEPGRGPRVLGVDDWAWRRGRRYGSVLVDLEAGRPAGTLWVPLPARTAAALEQWLKAHPGVEVVVRDRSTAYARGAAAGAPAAVQVLDRWHLLRNVRAVAERLLERYAQEWRELAEVPGPAATVRRRSAAEEARHAAGRQRASALHAAVRRLADEGVSLLGTAERLGISRVTVRKDRCCATPPARARPRFPSRLAPDEPYLRRRWAEGCRNARQLWRELRERGYPGGSRQVSRWAEARRERDPAAPRPGRPRAATEPAAVATTGARPARRPSAPRLAWLLVRDPGGLDDGDLALLGQLQAACPAAATAYPLLQELSRMLKERTPARLGAWLAAADACGVPDATTFAAGRRGEDDALRAALPLPWSTGPAEGQSTRLKPLERQGDGRRGRATLKRRCLQAA